VNATGFEQFVIDKKNYTLLMIDMKINSQMNCKLFNSCKKTKYASQVAAMSNAIGFTTFQVILQFLRLNHRAQKPIENVQFL